MALAARVYADALGQPGGGHARAYLERRGVDPELARRFGLGLAPEGWEFLIDALRADGVGEDVLVAGRVWPCRARTPVAPTTAFAAGSSFPSAIFRDAWSGFGGRALGDEQPKYLNSPETPIYSKGNLLYAADLAREGCLSRGRALLVEGYVDCLMAHQHGFTETVAALGTALHRGSARAPSPLLLRKSSRSSTPTPPARRRRSAPRNCWSLPSAGALWGINRSGAFDRGTPFRLRVALLAARS